ncbi:glycosyltransferase family 2 protein [Aeromonas veronii]|uniref:glycosyltransferase family 2 protein n=1 Tax=Aeromonas veronii TaxID=654 RepID=UPI0012F621B7|nr:glycosyltransferase family 2 protein [Aeromonas veronii]MCF5868437.1 glycosyltransferase [Aeromonas veronii]QGW96321.1 glycosyltransferase family 2 protein [Aeromonas veronii]
MLVSIIMPSYNSAETILNSIKSVQQQDYHKWELLITDDASTDNTVELVKQLAEIDPRINLEVNLVNSGAGFSRNQAIKRSKGKYIAFLDADDLWSPNKLSTQVAYMEQTGALFSYTAYQKFSDVGVGGVIMPPTRVTHHKLLKGCVIGCLTAMYNAEVLGRQMMPLIRKRQDMGLWLKLLKLCDEAHGIPEVLAQYRTDSGMSQNKLNAARYQWRLYRDVVGLNLLQSAWYFGWYAVNGFIKYRK